MAMATTRRTGVAASMSSRRRSSVSRQRRRLRLHGPRTRQPVEDSLLPLRCGRLIYGLFTAGERRDEAPISIAFTQNLRRELGGA